MKELRILCLAILLMGSGARNGASQSARNEMRGEIQDPQHRAGTVTDERVTLLDSPAGPGSAEVYLSSMKGEVFLSWLEAKAGNRYALEFSKWDGATWADPKPIASSKSFFVNWADFPSITALSDGSLVSHWLARSGDDTYAYDVLVSRSADAGNTWSQPVRPYRDDAKAQHGFVSLVDRGAGSFSMAWLDGREGEEMTLRLATFADGAFQPDILLDPRVCSCCQTAAVATEGGLFVAYRDRSSEEIRDISFVRLVDGAWTEPRTLHPDGWRIAGCPVNGPAAAAEGDRLVVVWPTVAGGLLRVKAIFSTDGGETFGEPVRIDGGDPVGRVDVKWSEDGGALVSWIENTANQTSEIRVRKIWPDGRTDDHFVAAETSSARASGFPRLVRAGSEIFIAWTEAGRPSQVRFAKIID